MIVDIILMVICILLSLLSIKSLVEYVLHKKERGGKVDQNEQGDKAMQVSVPAFSRPVSEIADFFEENNQIEYIEAYIKYLYDFRVDVPLEVVEYIYSFWKKQIRYKRGWRYLPNYEQTPIIENCLAGYNIAVIGETNAKILESIINKVGGKYTGAQYDSDTNIIIIHFKFQKLEIERMEKCKGARFKIMS